MSNPTTAATDRLAWVDHYISELSHLVATHCPKADIEVLEASFEDEDAHIVVYAPHDVGEDEVDRLSERLTKRSAKILLDTGILILAGVYEHSEKPRAR